MRGIWLGIASALAAVAMLGSSVCLLLAVDLDAARLFDLPGLVDVGPDAGRVLEVAMLLDLAGYLLLVPLAGVGVGLGLERHPMVARVGGVAGISYAMVGAYGASALAVEWPLLISLWDGAEPTRRLVIEAAFRSRTAFVWLVVWNSVGSTLGAAWWGSLAWTLRAHRPLLVVTAALTVAATADAVGVALGVGWLFHLGMTATVALLPVFAIVIGAVAWRS